MNVKNNGFSSIIFIKITVILLFFTIQIWRAPGVKKRVILKVWYQCLYLNNYVQIATIYSNHDFTRLDVFVLNVSYHSGVKGFAQPSYVWNEEFMPHSLKMINGILFRQMFTYNFNLTYSGNWITWPKRHAHL